MQRPQIFKKEHHRDFNCPLCTSTVILYPSGTKTPSTTSYPVTVPKNQSLPKAPSATNSQTKQSKGTLRVLQFNCNGISGKAPEIAALLAQNEVHMDLFWETKLKKQRCNPSISPLYTLIQKNRPKKGGGIQYEEVSLNTDGTLKAMCISVVAITSKLRTSNFYIPPRSSCPPKYTVSLTGRLVPGHALVLGDANADYFPGFQI